jgi:hypothetical protein
MSGIDAVGCLRSLRAHVALDGVSWVQSGSVEIAVGQTDRMLQNPRRHRLPPSGVAPLGSSVRSAWSSARSKASISIQQILAHETTNEQREATIEEALARSSTFAVDVLRQTLDDALRIIDDLALTTHAPGMASFTYWRQISQRARTHHAHAGRAGR